MRLVKQVTIFCVLCFGGFFSKALDLTKFNLQYLYNTNSGFECTYRVAQSNNDLVVYYAIQADSIAGFQHHYLLQNSYESEKHDTLSSYTLDTLSLTPTKGTFKLTISNVSQKLLLLSFISKEVASNTSMQFSLTLNQNFIYDVPISSSAGFPSFIPTDADRNPILKNFITSEPVRIAGDHPRYHAFAYRDDFGPADPAMGSMKQIAPSLEIDSSFFFQSELTNLLDFHFYLIQTDTLDDNGVTLLKCPSYYPELRKLDELIEPLTYITTPSEYRTMETQMSRSAFEDFWLNTYGTKFRAKNAIKNYYDRVEKANRLFTDYKQGWETDRGMLMIIFGTPDDVVRSDRYEIWRYKKGIEFEFIRISTLFTPSLYSLKRDKKYEEIWYEQVGNIRKGL